MNSKNKTSSKSLFMKTSQINKKLRNIARLKETVQDRVFELNGLIKLNKNNITSAVKPLLTLIQYHLNLIEDQIKLLHNLKNTVPVFEKLSVQDNYNKHNRKCSAAYSKWRSYENSISEICIYKSQHNTSVLKCVLCHHE